MFTRHGRRTALTVGALAMVVGLAGLRRQGEAGGLQQRDGKAPAGDAGGRPGRWRAGSTRPIRRWPTSTRRLDALEQELQAFRSEYTVSIEKVRGMLKFNVPVHFEYDSSELREADRPVLDRFAVGGDRVLSRRAGDRGRLHRSVRQRRLQPAARQAAGARRCRSTSRTSGGFGGDNLKAVSYGEARNRQVVPGAKGPGDQGIENRRVALVIDHAAVATDQVSLAD